jgi:exodeoxyribonuclease VII large subunit
MPIRTVTQVTQYVKMLVDSDLALADLWVEGEVSNLRRAPSGHCYFTLKDSECELHCVMWRTQASRHARLPDQGDWVEAHGYISVYERGGVYQFYVDTIERGGVGALWRAFEALRDRLQAEGLFAEERKRPLPRWPRRIGVVTSPSGAAFQDILNVLGARYPLVEVVLSPSLVQGSEAPESLVAALERLNQRDDIDVIIVARGGGSLEDLWAFNDERVARAIAGSRIPVVSGVGHETDVTIADLVADLRAPTPSAAAAAVVPDAAELAAALEAMAGRVAGLTTACLTGKRQELVREERLLRLHDPRRALAQHRQRLDDQLRRALSAAQHQGTLRRAHLAGLRAKLAALDARAVLARGYAIIRDGATGAVVGSVSRASLGQSIAVNLHDGHLGATVTDIRPAEGWAQGSGDTSPKVTSSP